MRESKGSEGEECPGGPPEPLAPPVTWLPAYDPRKDFRSLGGGNTESRFVDPSEVLTMDEVILRLSGDR